MEELVRERERLTQETRAAAGVELEKLGLVIDTLQIKDLEDPTGYIQNLAKPHAAEVEKNARIAQAQANQQATEAEAVAQAIHADAIRKSRISQAQYQAEIDQAASKAAQAGPLAAAVARQLVVVQETEVAKLEAARREQQLEAEVRRPADAARYRVEQEAQASRNAAIAEAEAGKASVIAAAEADAEQVRLNGASEKSRRTALAEAVRAEGEGQAAATAAVGDAEASAIRAKGFADAEAIERRAQALAANSEAVVMQQLAQNYPIGAPLHVQPELGAVAEDAREDERRRRGDGSAILAQLVDVLALNPHDLCQSALGEPHRVHKLLHKDFADGRRLALSHQHIQGLG